MALVARTLRPAGVRCSQVAIRVRLRAGEPQVTACSGYCALYPGAARTPPSPGNNPRRSVQSGRASGRILRARKTT